MDAVESIHIEFPADSGYVPYVRGLIADAVQVAGFGQKFSYRTELIVDELLGNTISQGGMDSATKLFCEMNSREVRLSVSDAAVSENSIPGEESKGLEIVRLLSSSMDVLPNENGASTIQVIHSSGKKLSGMEEA